MSSPRNRTQPRPLTTRGAILLIGGLLLAPGPTACTESPGERAATAGADPDAIERDLHDLVAAVTPPSASAPMSDRNAWFGRRKATLERLRSGGIALGRAALARYRSSERAIPEVRTGLLDIAAHAAPEDTREELVRLIRTYGDDLGLRTRACRFLAESSPRTALEVLEPILAQSQRSTTYPPDDRMLEAWLLACRRLENDPVPLLAAIVVDPERAPEGRHRAARALGEHPGSAARQALELVLTESGGNNYLRRLAAQSLQKILPADELCRKLRDVLDRESDTNFLQFLASMLETYCP